MSAHMQAALSLARRGLGVCAPNPSVGCVIVAEGRVVGRGHTQPGGRPHAETQALAMAGGRARGATAYVTLEPCCFQGRTSACTEALIAAGIARVVVAVRDPDPRVNGAGIARLREAGIEVIEGEQAEQAAALAAGLFARIRLGRPLVTLKLASTLDGRIATASGESQWITGAQARACAQALRGEHDAVLIGHGTARADNPALTCRLPGYRADQPVRLVADSQARISPDLTLVATAREIATWVLHTPQASEQNRTRLHAAGVTLIETAADRAGQVHLADALQKLAQAGLTRILAEGGGKLAAALLAADLVDGIAWFHAPAIMGGDGWPAIAACGTDHLAQLRRFTPIASQAMGEDRLTEFTRKSA